MSDVIRIANCSGFYGDRLDAAREMVEGGPIDVLTGDYLAELTMSILYNQQQSRGYQQNTRGCPARRLRTPSGRNKIKPKCRKNLGIFEGFIRRRHSKHSESFSCSW